MKTLYTTSAVATGNGRDGHVATLDGLLEAPVRMPKELGGAGGATNPEQLFAAGYAACFHSALKVVGQRQNVDVTGSEVSASVGIGAFPDGAFGLTVELDVHIPGLDHAAAEAAVAAAHAVCPYSNATRGNIDVTLTVV